jgi:hypothetical protein
MAWLVCLGSAESLQSLRRGLCAWVPPSLCRVSDVGCAPGFRRVSVARIGILSTRTSREMQPAITPLVDFRLAIAGASTLAFVQE